MVSVRLIMLSVVAVRSLRRGSVGLPLRSLRRCAASSGGGERRIDSAKNDLVKLCKSLHRRKGRESTGLVLLEGTRLVGDALAAGSGARHVLVSDSDVVWMRDPAAEIAELAALGATLGAATDCLDVDADRDKTERPEAPVMCGHAPGNKDGAVFNTGVLWFAADPSSIAFAQRWATPTRWQCATASSV